MLPLPNSKTNKNTGQNCSTYSFTITKRHVLPRRRGWFFVEDRLRHFAGGRLWQFGVTVVLVAAAQGQCPAQQNGVENGSHNLNVFYIFFSPVVKPVDDASL